MGRDLVIDNLYESKAYEKSLDDYTKKNNGIYYTPENIVDYMMEKTLKSHDILKNPMPKVLDLSCGCGNFLVKAYDIIYDMIEENIYGIRNIKGYEEFNFDNIHKHIIQNCIYGVDIDSEAIEILKNTLIKRDIDIEIDRFNLYCEDGLYIELNEKFDYIVGNPPYIGHKSLDNEYKKSLKKQYNDVYKDKSDIYYCFYKKIIDILNEDTIVSLITPRYFIESPSGRFLRQHIVNNACLEEIIDFSGCQIFKNIGVATCITTFKKYKYNKEINIFKVVNEELEVTNKNIDELIKTDLFEHFTINQNSLNSDWKLINTQQKKFLDKIEYSCNYELEEIVHSFQGIITGCDKAFILRKDNNIINDEHSNILKNWIKNKDINQYIINDNKYKLIYSNDINDENKEKYANLINNHISSYKEKLINRRECRKNIRKWYELQWGREKYLFEQIKIMYPYKSSFNKFAIDYNNSFCSADVYSFIIKENYKNEFSYEYIVGILNSSIYDKYFKIIGKKLSKNMYDYYPNKIMKLKIFKDNNYYKIESLSKEILKKLKSNEEYKDEIKNLQTKIDNLISESLNI